MKVVAFMLAVSIGGSILHAEEQEPIGVLTSHVLGMGVVVTIPTARAARKIERAAPSRQFWTQPTAEIRPATASTQQPFQGHKRISGKATAIIVVSIVAVLVYFASQLAGT